MAMLKGNNRLVGLMEESRSWPSREQETIRKLVSIRGWKILKCYRLKKTSDFQYERFQGPEKEGSPVVKREQADKLISRTITTVTRKF